MNYKKIGKLLVNASLVLFSFALLFSCSKDDPGEMKFEVANRIVANGDYLIVNCTTEGDVSIKNMSYFWDDSLIQSTNTPSGLNFLIKDQKVGALDQEAGGHILRVSVTDETKTTSSSEFYIQVYDKDKGFLGCLFESNNRKFKNGDHIKGEVVYIPSTTKAGYGGKLSEINIYIDDSNNKEECLQTITQAPYHFNIPVNNLSIGMHQLIFKHEIWYTAIFPGNTAAWNGPIVYSFTITE